MKILILLLALSVQTDRLSQMCDSVSVWMQQRTGVESQISVKRVLKRGGSIDLYFARTLSDYPWTAEDVKWLRSELSGALPRGYKLGEIFSSGVKLTDYLARPTAPDPGRSIRLVRDLSSKAFPLGLEGRHIALWQSHGLYFDEADSIWKWQRAPLHRTVEDLYTQTYVLQFLIPMLENAGAYVMTPRERDTNRSEIIIDNDPSFEGERGPLVRSSGSYSETGLWERGGTGFADFKEVYSGADNPFLAGTARKAVCMGPKATASATWSFDVSERGRYSVYVSYAGSPQNSRRAHYTVRHLSGITELEVDQTRGSGTWIRLGEFEFEGAGSVVLDNRGESGRVVCADAVRVGGGMGKTDRGAGISGVPSYCEGAIYNMQWSGIDEKVWTEKDGDYTNDYASRGAWVNYLLKEKGIPVDLALGFHTDAGTRQNDSIVGTLAIHTLRSEGRRKYSSGPDRMAGRRLALSVQDEVVRDIRANFDPEWTRRETWDRSYSETRVPEVPSMILELLSHQNFKDMKYGHDPAFKFTVSRAVYKGILKFLGEYYGCEYAVQPLPVRNFSVLPGPEGKAALEWEPTPDPAESTAAPSSYIVYTRIDDGAFDAGVEVSGTSVCLPVAKGHLYSYKVVAVGDGGRSFPSEILCYGESSTPAEGRVMIVNNFNRLGAPSCIEGESVAGFDAMQDSGVPYMQDLGYVGRVYDFDRSHEWISDSEPGFGASYTDYATRKVAGNTFDFVSLHAREFLRQGFPVCSSSVGAFAGASPAPADGVVILDLICGKEVNVWSEELKAAVRQAARDGVSLLVSGANVGTALKDDGSKFASDVLGIKWISSHASADGALQTGMKIWSEPNPHRYCVENPDAITTKYISKALSHGSIALRYSTGMLPAAVFYTSKTHKAATYGFPLECLQSDKDFEATIRQITEFLK